MSWVSSVEFGGVMGSAKSQEFLRDQPIEIPILHALIVLVLVHVEIVKVKEVGLSGFVNGAKGIQDGYCVVGCAPRSIPEKKTKSGESRYRWTTTTSTTTVCTTTTTTT